MALQYRITKRNNSIQNNTPQYILQAISRGTIDLDKLSADISNEFTLYVVRCSLMVMLIDFSIALFATQGTFNQNIF